MTKKIVIFGAGPGLGQSIANLFGKKGFDVTLLGRNQDRLEVQVKELKLDNINADSLICDVTDANDVKGAVLKLDIASNLPEVIVYNAFTFDSGNIEAESWENIKKELDVNVGGAFNVLKEVLPLSKKENKGNLFFTGGGLALYPHPAYVGLSMGKAALKNLLAGTNEDLKDSEIHLASVVVCGSIGGEDPKYHPDRIAENYWNLYSQKKGEFKHEIIY